VSARKHASSARAKICDSLCALHWMEMKLYSACHACSLFGTAWLSMFKQVDFHVSLLILQLSWSRPVY